MKLPQYGPREIKSVKVSSDRKRKLLLSYLPDWSAIPSVCVDSPHISSTQDHLYCACVRSTLNHLELTSSAPLQWRILCFGQHLWL